jgi:phage terminase large subunit
MPEVQATKVFKANYEALYNSDKRFICNEGSTRSSKTFSIVQLLIAHCWNNRDVKVTICAASLPRLKKGALQDFMDIIESWGIYREEWHNMTDNVYNFPSGSSIDFFGLEDPGKAHGPGRDILFINEANYVPKSVFDQLNIRTKWKVIIDLNPSDFNCWCYDLADGPDAVKIHSTYKDNPFLNKWQVQAIEAYQLGDPNLWQVYGLGLRGTSAEQIYTHWKLTDDIPDSNVFFGLDFGFTNPTALIRCAEKDGAIYAKEELYQSGLTTGELVQKMQELVKPGQSVYCDSADARSIEELYRAGFNVYPSDKDVWAGIMKVKSLPLFVERESKNLIRELGSYKWKVDKNGIVSDRDPVKEFDHICDALRYAVYTHLKTPAISWGVI